MTEAEREICSALAVLATSQVHLCHSATKATSGRQSRIDRLMALESITRCREALANIEAALTPPANAEAA